MKRKKTSTRYHLKEKERDEQTNFYYFCLHEIKGIQNYL